MANLKKYEFNVVNNPNDKVLKVKVFAYTKKEACEKIKKLSYCFDYISYKLKTIIRIPQDKMLEMFKLYVKENVYINEIYKRLTFYNQ